MIGSTSKSLSVGQVNYKKYFDQHVTTTVQFMYVQYILQFMEGEK